MRCATAKEGVGIKSVRGCEHRQHVARPRPRVQLGSGSGSGSGLGLGLGLGRRRTAARLMRASTTGCIIATANISARSSRSTCSGVVVMVVEVVVVMEGAVRVAAARAVEERVAVAREVVRVQGVLDAAPPRT